VEDGDPFVPEPVGQMCQSLALQVPGDCAGAVEQGAEQTGNGSPPLGCRWSLRCT
jgi:hypothetical protein